MTKTAINANVKTYKVQKQKVENEISTMRETLNEKPTLSKVLKQAEEQYKEYTNNHYDKVQAGKEVANPLEENLHNLTILSSPFESKKKYNARKLRGAKEIDAYNVELFDNLTNIENANLANASEFAKENAGALYDVALIQAELDGVTIDTETPIKIGRQVLEATGEHEE